MVKLIDECFLTNPQQYRHAEQFWLGLWNEIVQEAGVSNLWQTPWLGTPLRDGNPIFSAVSPSLRRGVSIIQHASTASEMELAAWLDKFGELGVDEVIDELVISCALSEEAAEQAQRLLAEWVRHGQIQTSDAAASRQRKR